MNFQTALATFATLDNNSEDYAFACGHLLQKIASTNGLDHDDLVNLNGFYQDAVVDAMTDGLSQEAVTSGVWQAYFELLENCEIIAKPFSVHRRKSIKTKNDMREEEDYAKALKIIEKVVSSHSLI